MNVFRGLLPQSEVVGYVHIRAPGPVRRALIRRALTPSSEICCGPILQSRTRRERTDHRYQSESLCYNPYTGEGGDMRHWSRSGSDREAR